MRSANTAQITHYTRNQLASLLRISDSHLRLLASDLREVLDESEFDFRPNDGLISADAAEKLIQYRALGKAKTRERAKQQIRLQGL